ncbi:integrase core domain-containing protein [Burkholderia cenocepacia]|nr:integrase core domain-containing protein [Burkholderia cenocepacia]
MPDALGMTFDIGNWQWRGEAPLDCAQVLAPHVDYIHCKAIEGEGARRFAAAPAPNDPLVTGVLAALAQHAPRGIEFPFDAADLAGDACRRVEQSIRIYNHERPHAALKYKTPDAVHRAF